MKDTKNTPETQKKELSFSLKYLFGVGDAGFNLMSNIETFYFMTFLTDLAAFSPAIAGLINSVFSTEICQFFLSQPLFFPVMQDV